MIDKRIPTPAEAVAGVKDGDMVLISGFGEAGNPTELIHALIDLGTKDLTVVNNNAGNGHIGLAALLEAGRVAKIICSFPRSSRSGVFQELYGTGKIELEVVPQGTLAERLRAGGAGIGGFYTPTTVGTPLAEGKETRQFDSRWYVLETALHADVSLVKAWKADEEGNLVYRMTAQNFNPPMAEAGAVTVAEVEEIVRIGEIDSQQVHTPGIYVDRIVRTEQKETLIERRTTRLG